MTDTRTYRLVETDAHYCMSFGGNIERKIPKDSVKNKDKLREDWIRQMSLAKVMMDAKQEGDWDAAASIACDILAS